MEKDIRREIYIKLYYSLLDWAWIHNPNTLVVFIHLLLNANRKDQPYNKDIIHRGEVLCSREFLSKQSGLSIQQVRTALDHLEATGEITQRLVNNICVFRLNNYCKWQDGNKQSNNSSTTYQQTANNSSTNEQQSANNLSTTPIYCNNEDNEIMKECESVRAHALGKFSNVFISHDESEQFRKDFPHTADEIIDELSEKIATGEKKYQTGHLGHLYIFARNYKGKPKQPNAPSYDINLALSKAKKLDPTKTKRNN